MSTALVVMETMTAVELFKPGAIDPILEQIKEESRKQAAELDISTEANRKALASLAFKIARSKTFLDAQGKALVADEKKRLANIDAERGRVWGELEALQKEIRQPLTDWENAEKARVTCHEEALNVLRNLSMTPSRDSSEVTEHIEKANNLFANRDWQEFAKRASDAKSAVLFELNSQLKTMQEAESARAEMERKRAEAAEQAIKEREEAAAKSAREQAERRAAEQARLAQVAAERERQRVEQERAEAEARAKQAEARRIADAEAAERRAKEAAQKAERDKQAAIEAERQRVAEERRKEVEEAERKAKNRAHQASVNREVKAALLERFASAPYCMNEIAAEAIIKAVAKGDIPHVTINY